MKQEDYNDKIMSHAPRCPRCGERYSGDGQALCTECAADYIDPIPKVDDDLDYVCCTSCDWEGYVTAGADDCPQCHANGNLQWADEERGEV